jgi:pimeloyl-ACP methyl ester carboxylesterase
MISSTRTRTPEPRLVPTPLGDLAVRVAGYGPTNLVLWPSIFTDGHIYDGLVSRMAAEATFFLVDGPGHGLSPGLAREFTMAEAASACLSVMDTFGLARAVVGGVSWGGLVAAEVALTAPGRVEGLVLMNTPMDISGAHRKFRDQMISFGARWMGRQKMFRDGVAGSFFDPRTLPSNPSYRQAFHSMLAACDPVRLSAAVRSVILGGDPLRGRLARISVPTLLIAGKEDALYPLEGQASAALLLQDGRFEPVAGRHISPIEAPDEVAASLRAFLGGEKAG